MKNIISKYSTLFLTIGVSVSIIGIIVSVISVIGIKSELIIGMFASVLAAFTTFIFTYLVGYKHKKEVSMIEKSIAILQDEIKFQLKEKKGVEDKPKIFLSYSHKDQDTAKKIVNMLRKANLNVWFDENEIQVGDSFTDKIDQAIDKSNYILPIISNNSVKSKQLNREIGIAIKEKKKILPILIENVNPPEQISSIKYANFGIDYNQGLNDLLKALSADIKAYKKCRMANEQFHASKM